MKCKDCKAKIKKDILFCPFCGRENVKKEKDFKVDITIILDRSGSMSSMKEEVEKGYDGYILEQKNIKKPMTVTLHQFDNQFETVYENIDINDVPKLNFQPRSTTALYDAVGNAITKKINSWCDIPHKQRPKKTLFCIITDGYENASVEYTGKQISGLIHRCKTEYDWEFAFIGAGIDAFNESGKISIGRGQTYKASNDEVGIGSIFNVVSSSTKKYRKDPTWSYCFSDDKD